MLFDIPAAKATLEVLVVQTDFYTKKDTGEIFASLQGFSPIPKGSKERPNARGFEFTGYACDPSVLEEIDFANGPVKMKFETAVRPTRDQYGRIENKQVIVAVVHESSAPRPAASTAPNKPADKVNG
ncbi:DNA-binding protein [Pseudomonas mangiferae]|uniref:DNA-binding protein n=1 Tax=Pseudomonas mangiferae TaxID=2593654 RepID=A0A553H1L9_9PSED|nr:DNA-binding protein [Pseudomonas mangiferae]TRX75647.1 DNA-binding protein [Pseudomonas mangiferae]